MAKKRSYSISSKRGLGASDRDHHKHLSKLKEKGPMKWHTSDPARGSRKLALKNGQSTLPTAVTTRGADSRFRRHVGRIRRDGLVYDLRIGWYQVSSGSYIL